MGFRGVAKQIYRRIRRQDANHGGKAHKPQIVSSGDALINL